MRLLPLAFVAVSLAACTSTYHPEYHPVTATTITQTYSSPGILATRSAVQQPIVVAPAPSPPVIVEQPPAANPDAFFDTSYR